ncbi:MAG: NfeD family protein, partial [Pseudomonadota bacterium]
RKKIFEDTRSFVEGLAEYRGRSTEFAKAIVDEAKALSAQDALNEGAIDVVVSDIEAFLQFAKGKPVRMEADQTAKVEVGPLQLFQPGLRHDVLQIFSNPQWAYLLFMGSIGLLYFELTHPGTSLPGVIGAIGLVISLVNFHMLDVSWAGVALILLGMAFLFAELFIPSFGALGLGGLASFVIGSLFLFDEKSGYSIPKDLLFTTSGVLFVLMAGVTYLAVTAQNSGLRNREKEKMEGKTLSVQSLTKNKKQGLAKYKGELWKIKSKKELFEGDKVRVTSVDGLTLNVDLDKEV